MMMRAIITGGGTGGHIYPALAIARGLKDRVPDMELLYVGTKGGLEADIVPKSGLSFSTISVEGFSRPFSHKTLVSVLRAIGGVKQASSLVHEFKPDVVVGTGGYVCGPVVLSAALAGIPTAIHEQNSVPGLTNRILARFVTRICATFEDSLRYFPDKNKVSLTGLPVRPEVLAARREPALKFLGLDRDKITVVVTGGSQGAKSINRAMVPVMEKLAVNPKIQFVHITGTAGFEETRNLLKTRGLEVNRKGDIFLVPYLYEMQHALAAADIIVGRAGASFLSEVLVHGIPAVLVPFPYAAANHQEYNARSLERRGAAKVVLDSELDSGKLLEILEILINSPALRTQMYEAARNMAKISALEDIIEIVVGISKRGAGVS